MAPTRSIRRIGVVGVFFGYRKMQTASNKNIVEEVSSEKDNLFVQSKKLPIVVIGSGPVGLRFIQALRKRDSTQPIILYGKEPWEPYNRVKLSSLLSGDIKFNDIKNAVFDDLDPHLICRFNCAVLKIDTFAKILIDENGGCQPYEKLVLAMGSRAHVPSIKGIDKKGVYVFRDLTDTQQLIARQVRTRKVVVIGGGLLGIEAAKAMQRNNTEVTIIEHMPRLLSTQLDEDAAALLREYIMSLGIHVRLGNSVHEVLHNKHGVSGIKLSSGLKISCDTVIVSAGIRPNVEIARDAHISVGKGVRVDDSMQTNIKDIYAIGECCEHRKKVYGLVAPGYEQAEVAAHTIVNGKSKYKGSIASSNLKVIDKPVFSMGEVLSEGYDLIYSEYKYVNCSKDVYRKIIVKNRRIVGAISVGEWKEQRRIQSLISNKKLLLPWQISRFKQTGNLLSDKDEADVKGWPSSAVVCNCTGRTRGEISNAIVNGCQSVEDVADKTGASTVCGSCKPLLVNLLDSKESIKPVGFSKSINVISIALIILAILTYGVGSLSYNLSAENIIQWDVIWRNTLIKQITGFSILGLSIIAVSLSLRKRVKKITFGGFDMWRGLHVFISTLVVVTLFMHTGFRVGDNLNAYLMLFFIAMLLIGSLSAITISLTHKFDLITMTNLRKKLVWGHIILFWPVPVLLMFHILKSYYF